MASRTASSSRGNARASAALVAGLCGVLALPAAIALARKTHAIVLVDAAYAIPFAIAFSICALLFARGAQGRIRSTLERAGGRGRVRWSRRLAVLGIAIALSASIAVGFYELLLRLEGN
jgi:ABC-type sugar transport system permease subunit